MRFFHAPIVSAIADRSSANNSGRANPQKIDIIRAMHDSAALCIKRTKKNEALQGL